METTNYKYKECTVLALFLKAVSGIGLPSRVRGDLALKLLMWHGSCSHTSTGWTRTRKLYSGKEPSQSASNRKVLERPFPWLHLPVSPSDDMTRGFGNEDYSSTKYDSTTRTNGSTTRSKDTRTENENFNVTKYDPTTRTKDTNFVPDLTP